MPLTIRLDPKAQRALDELARRRGQTRSDLVREAIEHYTTLSGSDTRGPGPYDAWSDVIGIVRSGGRNRQKTTGEIFTDLVVEKARARRPR